MKLHLTRALQQDVIAAVERDVGRKYSQADIKHHLAAVFNDIVGGFHEPGANRQQVIEWLSHEVQHYLYEQHDVDYSYREYTSENG